MVSTYIGVILIGLLHGLEPGHGWPIAALYSLKKQNKYWFGFLAALIIAFFHFVSSIAVVLLFLFVDSKIDLSSYPVIRYIAAGLLFYMAYRFWTEHEHSHIEQKKVKNLWNIATFAFVLGFVHEEEFALLAFCLDNINCLLLMISYATAVSISLIGITLASIYAYQKIQHKMHRIEHYLPKISAIILFILALLFIFKAI